MTGEKKPRKNPDYSASAVNLINPPEVFTRLNSILDLKNQIVSVRHTIDVLIPQALKDELAGLESQLGQADKGIRLSIDEFGSFQGVDAG